MGEIVCFNRSDQEQYGDAQYLADLAENGRFWHELYLSGTALTAEGLAAGKAEKVFVLELDGIDLRGKMPKLVSLFPALKRLSIRRCGVTDKDVSRLSRLSSLESVAADFGALTLKGVRTLSRIHSLKSISLCGVSLPQSALQILLTLPELERLDLRGTGLSCDGVNSGRVRVGCGNYVQPAPYTRTVEPAGAH